MSKEGVTRIPARDASKSFLESTGKTRGASIVKIAVAALLLLVVYWPALHGSPLWDDDAHITKPELQSWNGLWRIWFELGATQQYYPLTHSVFWVQHFLWGDVTLGYHLTNLVLHGVSALLVFRLLDRLHVPGSGLAAAIFAFHPVMVESVAWISELKNTLSGVCFLAAILVYINFDENRKFGTYFLALLLFILGLLSKSVIATLPAVLLVIFWYQRGKLSFKRDILPLLPWFAIGSSVGLFTAWVEQRFIGAEGESFALSFVQRLILAGRVFWFYLGKLIWPIDLMFVYPRWKIDGSAISNYLYIGTAVGMLLILATLRNRSRAPLASLLLYSGLLFPVLGFFNIYPFLFSYVADHFQYLASLVVITGGAAAWTQFQDRFISSRTLLNHGSTLLIIAVLSILTWRQSRRYIDARTLYSVTLEQNPTCWMAHSNLGDILARDGKVSEALVHYQEAISENPTYANTYNNLGFALLKTGRYDDAINAFKNGIKIKPQFAEMHYNLGDALLLTDRAAEAIDEYTTALRIKPSFEEVHCNLANALYRTGKYEDAIAHYRFALRKYNNSSALHFNLGISYLGAGQVILAREQFEAALQIDPDFAAAKLHVDEIDSANPGL